MISTLSVPVQVQPSKQSETASLESLLPRDKPVQASVVSSQPTRTPDMNRVMLQLQNQLLEIRLPQQLQTGQQVSLNRQPSGQILLSVLENAPTTTTVKQQPSTESGRPQPATTASAAADTQSNLQLKLPAATREALNNAFRHAPANEVNAVVISSLPVKAKPGNEGTTPRPAPPSPTLAGDNQSPPAGTSKSEPKANTAAEAGPNASRAGTDPSRTQSSQNQLQSGSAATRTEPAAGPRTTAGPAPTQTAPAIQPSMLRTEQTPVATAAAILPKAGAMVAAPTTGNSATQPHPATGGTNSLPTNPPAASLTPPAPATPASTGPATTHQPAAEGAKPAVTTTPSPQVPNSGSPKAPIAAPSAALNNGNIPAPQPQTGPVGNPAPTVITASNPSPATAQNNARPNSAATPPSPAPAQSVTPATQTTTPPAPTTEPRSGIGRPATAGQQAPGTAIAPAASPSAQPATSQTPAGTPVSRTEAPISRTGAPLSPAAASTPGTDLRVTNTVPTTPAAITQPVTPMTKGTGFQLQLALGNGSNIQLQSDKPLPQGSQLQFSLQSDGSVASRILSTTTQPSALDQQEIQSSLRQALPQQISVGNALTQLNQLTTEQNNSPINSVVRSMLQLFGFKPSQRSPVVIKQNIELGGQQTENQLARTRQSNSQDMKSQLSVLQQLSKQLPEADANRLDQLVQGIKSRITGQQIHALQQRKEQPDGQFERVLQLDIPVHYQNKLENVELRISHEAQAHQGEELTPQWRVRLHFDLEDDGSIDAEIRLRENDQLSTHFWCDRRSTYLKLQQNLDAFNKHLLQQGYTEAELQCHHGKAPQKQAPVQKQLIDLRT